jgi:hypothetical protein
MAHEIRITLSRGVVVAFVLIAVGIPALVTIADAKQQAGAAEALAALHRLPVGAIIMWGQNQALPGGGWIVCDSTAGTPDLTGRVPLGVKTTGESGRHGTLGHTHTVAGGTGGTDGHEHVIKVSTSEPVPLAGTTTVVFLCKNK